MQKELYHIAFLAVLFVSCEEYYKPEMKKVQALIVVESLVTNDSKQNYVKLTKSLGFYSTDQEEKIEGAKVELIENEGSSLTGIESSTGIFTFSNTPIPGKTYYLRIFWGNDTYESEKVVMPPLPTIDTLYTKHVISQSYRNEIYGPPILVETPGREVCIDATFTPELEYYRFNWRAVLQWVSKPYYGWTSKYDNGIFNIVGSKDFNLSAKITQHPVLFLQYDTQDFLDPSQTPLGWIVIVDQYGIQRESYDFYETLNKQISAEGNLFDPVLTQVNGNIHCTNDTSKVVAGFFNLNSYRQYRYFLRIGMRVNVENYAIQRRINRYPDIPYYGCVGVRPEFWEYY